MHHWHTSHLAMQMSYRETLDYLYQHLPVYHRIGAAAYKNDLHNTLALCDHLGNPQDKFPTIHVAGTNGKGSVSHLLAAVCQAAGWKTGLYISPHYKDFRERIKINGQYIARQRVVDFVARHHPALEAIQPSFFEMCVAMAFDHFAREQVDIAIIEVGLGGRLDSTNVITPLLSVITNISYDHQNLLGDTLPLIAGEKAGIIKAGVSVVIGERQAESAPVFQARAAAVGAPIVFADQHFRLVEKSTNAWKSTVYDVFKDEKIYLENLLVDTVGPYQNKNVATALQALEKMGNGEYGMRSTEYRMQNVSLPSTIRQGFGNLRALTRFQGRWQVIGQHPTVLCDSAHNEAGLRLAFAEIQSLVFRRLHIVTGFVNDKSLEQVLCLFPPAARYYFAKADIPRGLDAELLRKTAAAFQLYGRAYASVRGALRAARRAAAPDDLVVVIGSIFVVAEVL